MSLKRTDQKNKRSVKSKILLCVIIVLIGVLGFSVYQVLSVYIPQQKEQERFAQLRELIGEDEYEDEEPSLSDVSAAPGETTAKVVKTSKYEQLFSRYEDMCGWLRVDGTPIDYPVMKSDRDNGEYYLHRDIDGYDSFAGCLFIGKNCDASSDIFIIYGHNMKNGSMFGELTDFADEGFVRSHRDICFDTDKERRVYRVFASFYAMTYGKEETAPFKYYETIGSLDQAAYDAALDHYRYSSSVWTGDVPQYPDQIMLLSTCYTDKERFVVAAYRIQ